ncbi:MAG: ArnT family glycosyltransferase [Anaerolineales bacterium]
MRRSTYRIAALLALGATLATRLLWLRQTAPPPIGPVDAEGYHLLALNMLAGRGFAIGWTPPFCATAIRPPLYPLFLMLNYLALGASPARAVLMQVLLAVLTTALVIRLGREVGGARAGVLAGWLYVLNGTTQRYIGYLLAETLLLPLMTAALWASVRSLKRPSIRKNLLAGALWGLTLLTKPNVQYLALFIGGLITMRLVVARHSAVASLVYPPKGDLAQPPPGFLRITHYARRALPFWLALLLILCPWLARNRIVMGRWMLSDAFEENLARVSAVATLAEVAQVQAAPWTPTWEFIYDMLELRAAIRYDWNAAEVDVGACEARTERHRQLAALAREVLVQHPRAWITAHLRGVGRSLLDVGHHYWYRTLCGRAWETTGVAPDIWARMGWSLKRGAFGDAIAALVRERIARPPWPAALLWWALLSGRLLVWALSLRGLARLRSAPDIALLLGMTVAYVVILPGPIAYDRFYTPAIPAVVVLMAQKRPDRFRNLSGL